LAYGKKEVTMQTKRLGKSDLFITPVGFGSWAAGGGGWPLRLPAVTGAIVGGRAPEQVEGIIGAGTFRLSEAEIAEIDAFRQMAVKRQ
jgi:aryl-alcohol dehydrogenase-like predicted oxidoreductase